MTTASAPSPLADADGRRRIREDLDVTLWVEAAAGTGKTSALVSRIVALLRSGRATLDRVVAVTFTEKAAGEMKLRLRAEIERARTADGAGEERARLDRALEHLELARIHTIHAFAADLLRERPVEAGVDPLFEVAAEDEARRLLDRAFNGWFQAVLADPPEGVRRFLRRRKRRRDERGPREQLRGAAERLVNFRDFPSAWRRPAFDRVSAIDGLLVELAELGSFAHRAERADDWLARNLFELLRFSEENALRESVRGREARDRRDHDGLEAELWELRRRAHWNWRGSPQRPYGPGLDRSRLVARRDAAKQRLDDFLASAGADVAALLREELRPVIEAYEQLKRREGRLDFLDLLIRARDLVRDERSVREGLQQRFTHFFVDEFQDTDPLQVELLMLLTADDPAETDWRRARPAPGKLFLVGDPKQSIYRFRRADVAMYEAVKRALLGAGGELLHLTTSFRSRPEIQSFVNAAFAPVITSNAEGSQADYVPLRPYRAADPMQPSVVALPVPKPYADHGKVVNWRIEESFPEAVGAFVSWLVKESGWTVEDRGERVPIRPRHVCLLFRRFQSWEDMTRAYVRALEKRRIPHVLVGGRSFHEREEVLAVRNALAAIEWPDDELRVFATLRGPFFALTDDALLAWRHRVGRCHPLRRLAPEALAALDRPEQDVAEALVVLGELHGSRNRRPSAETLARLLEATRAHAGLAVWPTGEQALANVLRTIDLARRFERGGAPSFRAFVEHLEGEAERGDAQDAPVVEEGTEGVRILTVHRAKGLEFPIVILADPTARLTRREPSRHVDPERGLWAEPLSGCVPLDLAEAAAEEHRRDEEEGLRIAYVAATRARDLLVVPALGDEELGAPDGDEPGGWLAVLNPALHPPASKRRASGSAPGCPGFGTDSVRVRPAKCRRTASASVRPGLHRPRAGDHRVVWWDPSLLDLDREEELGLRQQQILEADAGEERARAGSEAHRHWQEARSAALASGAKPSLVVASVTALAATAPEVPEGAVRTVARHEVKVERASRAGRADRPGGARFGTLVHAALAAVDLHADAAGVGSTVRAQARILGAPEEESAAAEAAVGAALAHPLLRRAAACPRGHLRRETPVFLRLADGSLAEGVVDLAFREVAEEAASWTVVDFKTDHEIEAHRDRYFEQVRLYARAIETATGEPARAVILSV